MEMEIYFLPNFARKHFAKLDSSSKIILGCFTRAGLSVILHPIFILLRRIFSEIFGSAAS
jgi:hypothetical protein